jgi:phosphoribosylamine--glycine ligase
MTDANLLALPVPQQVLVVGRGGREHALVHALGQSGAKVYATRPNPGMAPLCRAVDVDPLDVAGVVAVAQQLQVDLVVVGPEAPLVAGLADALRAVGIATFGPGQDAAQLEGSKAFAKAFLVRHGIPTAAAEVVSDLDAALAFVAKVGAPLVVKADGLAAGKGVVVAETVAEAEAAVQAFLGDKTLGQAGATLLLEQFLTGPEVSALACVMASGSWRWTWPATTSAFLTVTKVTTRAAWAPSARCQRSMPRRCSRSEPRCWSRHLRA